ncbi:hypothetical protein HETIRDRAFT_174687 [Heterobasidion irregulare TC 32-1]|uniref:Uncharacterized protein n=1 Tax=Heterobasidion irregulare (strain TC 32-1) TaxID=747525 RepID=W4JT51_HETIT|nr:uncharacterized protein HETIRDRAFT_174687 [Heterobasidion irregulare TC 32-1]ETW76639.1 hypothetical protein HETIRDRAFT_174687 [Heterobasidion irregulare TC 32-1]
MPRNLNLLSITTTHLNTHPSTHPNTGPIHGRPCRCPCRCRCKGVIRRRKATGSVHGWHGSWLLGALWSGLSVCIISGVGAVSCYLCFALLFAVGVCTLIFISG